MFISQPIFEFLAKEHIEGLLGFGKFLGFVFVPVLPSVRVPYRGELSPGVALQGDTGRVTP